MTGKAPSRSKRLWLGGALVAILAGLLVAAAGTGDREPVDPARARYEAAFGGAFTLVGTDGRPITDRDFRGAPFAVFFGFTRCPDVCPTTLARLARLKRAIGPEADQLRVLFITVDPANDTPAEIRRYLDLFDARMAGATGSEAELKAMRDRYQAIARQVPGEAGGYTIDHSTTVFLMGRRGEFLTTIDAHEPDEMALAKLRRAAGGAP